MNDEQRLSYGGADGPTLVALALAWSSAESEGAPRSLCRLPAQ